MMPLLCPMSIHFKKNSERIACSLLATLCLLLSAQVNAGTEGSLDLLKNQEGKILLALSIQWEGENLLDSNLNAIAEFREKFSSISFLQFVNPVYFTKDNANTEDVRSKIASVMRSNDSLGLQLLGWRSLIEGAGVTYRSAPTFWGNRPEVRPDSKDIGHEVPISTYSQDELSKIFEHGIDIFSKNGFPRPISFMAGGWMATTQVLEACAREGIKYDFSGIPPSAIATKAKRFPIYQWLADLWARTTPFSQPTPIPTEAGWIQEYYNNGGTLDYASESDIVDLYRAYANLLKKDPSRPYVLHIGIYQETAAKTLPKLASILQTIFAESAKNETPVAMLTIPQAFLTGLAAPHVEVRSGSSRQERTVQ
jgi:hypothetical protein